jgi:hypothetical protein
MLLQRISFVVPPTLFLLLDFCVLLLVQKHQKDRRKLGVPQPTDLVSV